MKIHIRVLSIAFALATTLGVLSNIFRYLAIVHRGQDCLLLLAVGTLPSIIVSPLLFFVIFFIVGARALVLLIPFIFLCWKCNWTHFWNLYCDIAPSDSHTNEHSCNSCSGTGESYGLSFFTQFLCRLQRISL